MKITSTEFKDLYIIEPKIFKDSRGYFSEAFNQDFFDSNGLEYNFIQDNESYSVQNVVRGLHFQIPPYTQAKLVRVSFGEVQDIVVDLRKSSNMFGKYFSINLSSENNKQLLIPRGFAHGFLVKSSCAIFSYKVDNVYSKDHDSGICWNDKDLNINWDIQTQNIISSKKDSLLMNFKKFNTPFE